MPFALKNPYANAGFDGETRAGEVLDDLSTPKKAKKAPLADSLVQSVSFAWLRLFVKLFYVEVMMDNSRKPNRSQRLPSIGPLNVCIYKVTNRAGDVWSNFEGTMASLWQVRHTRVVKYV